MDYEVLEEDSIHLKFKAVLKDALLDELKKKALKDVQKEVSYPGFRKGKVPLDIIEAHFLDKLEEKFSKILERELPSFFLKDDKVKEYFDNDVDNKLFNILLFVDDKDSNSPLYKRDEIPFNITLEKYPKIIIPEDNILDGISVRNVVVPEELSYLNDDVVAEYLWWVQSKLMGLSDKEGLREGGFAQFIVDVLYPINTIKHFFVGGSRFIKNELFEELKGIKIGEERKIKVKGKYVGLFDDRADKSVKVKFSCMYVAPPYTDELFESFRGKEEYSWVRDAIKDTVKSSPENYMGINILTKAFDKIGSRKDIQDYVFLPESFFIKNIDSAIRFVYKINKGIAEFSKEEADKIIKDITPIISSLAVLKAVEKHILTGEKEIVLSREDSIFSFALKDIVAKVRETNLKEEISLTEEEAFNVFGGDVFANLYNIILLFSANQQQRR